MSSISTFCGFLEKKSTRLKNWNLRWFVLHNRRLLYFKDETLAKCQGELVIDSSFDVEVQKSEGGRTYVFCIKDTESDVLWWLSAPNMTLIESWMIGLLQAINGDMRKSENFDTGNSAETPLFQPLPGNALISVQDNMESMTSENKPEGELMGLFMKRAISESIWKERCVVLRKGRLTLYALEEDACDDINARGSRRLDRYTKVAVMPIEYEGHQHCFAVVTTNPPHADCVTLRLSAPDENTMNTWIHRIRQEVISLIAEDNIALVRLPLPEILARRPPDGYSIISYSRNSSTDLLPIGKDNNISSNPRSNEDYYASHFVIAISEVGGADSTHNWVRVEVFQNERYLPLLGWSSHHLLPGDPHKLSSASGMRFLTRNLHQMFPPSGYQWLSTPITCRTNRTDVPRSSMAAATTIAADYMPDTANFTLTADSHDSEFADLGDATFDVDDFSDCRTPKRTYFASLESPNKKTKAAGTKDVLVGQYQFEVDLTYTNTGDDGWTYASHFEKFVDHLSENSSHHQRKGRDMVRRRKWVRLAEPVEVTITAGMREDYLLDT